MRKKLFIIGAGASKQIRSYPTGIELLNKVENYYRIPLHESRKYYQPTFNHNIIDQDRQPLINKIESLRNQDNPKDLIESLSNFCEDEKNRLFAMGIDTVFHKCPTEEWKRSALLSILIKINNPSSIDDFTQNLKLYFLPEYESLANTSCESLQKRAQEIVTNILQEIKQNTTYPKQQIYFYKIIHKLQKQLDNISIINFNYDSILEEVFEFFIKNRNCKELNEDGLDNLEKVIKESHVYGSIENGITFMRKINDDQINKHWKMFVDAEDVYFLGFGFDKLNINNLGLFNLTNTNKLLDFSNKKRVYITNYAGDNNRFEPRILNKIRDIFSIRDFKESNNISFFLEGESSLFTFQERVKLIKNIRVFISGLSVPQAIETDFNLD